MIEYVCVCVIRGESKLNAKNEWTREMKAKCVSAHNIE